MVFVIISTLYSGGGAEVQAVHEFRYINQNSEDKAYLITFDPKLRTGESCEQNHINLLGSYSDRYRRVYDVFLNTEILSELKSFFEKIKPDVVHIHKVSFAYKTIVKTVASFYVIETIHDYSYICNKGTFIKENNQVCHGANFGSCLGCYKKNLKSLFKIIYRMVVNGSIKKYRQKYVDNIIAPSKKLTDVLIKHGYEAMCVNNSIEIYKTTDNTDNKFNKKIVVFAGSIRKEKGIYQLIDAYKKEDYKNIELHFVGDIERDVEFITHKMKAKGIIYHGIVSHEKMRYIYEGAFSVIIPSLWVENYPNVALEGILNNCIICGSNRGGIPELVCNKKLIFDVLISDEIKNCLKTLDNITFDEYLQICNAQREKFKCNNTPDAFYKKLIILYNDWSKFHK